MHICKSKWLHLQFTYQYQVIFHIFSLLPDVYIICVFNLLSKDSGRKLLTKTPEQVSRLGVGSTYNFRDAFEFQTTIDSI